jgi:hypothetical protein
VSPEQIQSGVELRAGIDTETVRGLQLLNGGMAGGLVTILPLLARDPIFTALGKWMIAGIVCAAMGLVLATIHNRFRRKCSLEHARGAGADRPYSARVLTKCQSVPGEPRICTLSVIAMWASLVCFSVGAMLVCVGFLGVHPSAAEAAIPCWELQHINDHIYKFNRCTGSAEAYGGK